MLRWFIDSYYRTILSFSKVNSLYCPRVYVCGNGEENKPKAPQIIRCVLLLLKCRMWAYVCDERFLLTHD